jgi:hypothetical protein
MAQPTQAGGQFIEVVVSDFLLAAIQRADVQVILQIATHIGQVGDHFDGVLAQMIGRTEPGQHQQLRRVDGAGSEDHFTGFDSLHSVSTAPQLHAGRTAVVEQHAFDQRVRAHLQVGAMANGFQIGGGGRAACAIALGDLIQPEAGLLLAVEIVGARMAGARARLNQGCR